MYHIDTFSFSSLTFFFISFLFYLTFKSKSALHSHHFRSSEVAGENPSQWLSGNPVNQFLISVLKTTSWLEMTEKDIRCKWGKDTSLLTSGAFPLLSFLHLLCPNSFCFKWKLLHSFSVSGKCSFNFLYMCTNVRCVSFKICCPDVPQDPCSPGFSRWV